jgi:uncharacterized protein (TIGR02453 family)
MMADSLTLQPVMRFVRSLKRNNNREWFEAHRAGYEEARHHFEVYVGALIDGLARTEVLGPLSPRDCIFRLNRDLRFSRDKTPYKPFMSAYIAPGGRKSRRLGYYVHIEAGNHSMIAGGLHEPDPQELAAWRAAIDEDPRPFRRIVSTTRFRNTFGTVRGDRLKTAPTGYRMDHPELALLQLKQVLVWRELHDSVVVSPRILKETLATFKAMRPFLEYLRGLA